MTAKRNLFVRLVPCRCLRGEEEVVTALDYSHCSLEQVPKEIFTFEKTLEELYLDANQIEELPKQLFSCQMLHRLSLPDNDLTALPPAIANLINLKELDVSKNSIQEFPENIKNCKVLTIVEASVNPISKLPESFTQLLSLTQLYLNDAFLEFLPASFGRLTKLQILELRENQLKTLPKSMHKLSLLERLDLGSNEFTQVPEVLPQLTGIKELWVDGNRLTSLPGVIGALKQLTYLDVSKNNIEKVDEQISGCENLQDLLLSSNALSQLPASIGSLKKLTTLKVDENQLMYLPDSIGGLSVLEELDCSFNEMEALPSSIGQCVNLRTFAADHNFLTQLPPEIGSWKTVTVLFLHSNKLETLPEEMGDMDRLKVINLSDNRLRNLPFSFTKLSQLTAMWLSENQSKPLIPLQKEEDQETSKTMLTNYMFPQQTRTDDYIPVSDNESFNPSLWEEQRKQRAQVAFECDEDKDDREAPPREGNLKRYPTPYPEELKNMVKTAQSIAHRLKEEESSEESGKEAKLLDTVPVGLQNVGVKVIESTCANGETVESDPKSAMSKTESFSTPEPRESPDMQNSESTSLNTTNGTATNQDHALKESVDLSFGEEGMKMAEMLPPLLECSNSQPKVVTLNKERRDDSKDTDSLLDETAANSNHNNSNCSSPSRMSDSVSMTSESSQDASPCTPEKEAKTPITPQCRQEDENQNQLEDTASLLQNGNGSDASLQPVVKSQQDYGSRSEKTSEFDPATEEKLPLIDRGTDLRNGLGDPYSQWDQINMNVSQLPPDNGVQPDSLGETTNVYTPGDFQKGSMLNNNNNAPDHLLNGNKDQKQTFMEHINGHTDETPKFEVSHMATVHITASSEMPSSQTAEELSPQKKGTAAPMVKSQSVTSTEVDGMKIYNLDGGGGPNEASVTDAGVQGHGVIRSKSGSFVNDPSLQVYPGSSVVSSDLVPSSKTPVRYETSTGRVMVPANMPPPQYNVQYTSSAVPAENLWTQRTPVPPDQMYLPPHHSLANTNYSNRNNAPSYLLQPQQRGMPRPVDAWGKDRFLPPAPPRSSVQRQSSSSSTASMPDPRRIHLPDGGEYMTYWDIQAMGRGPPQMGPSGQRPLSARTYSMDGPSASRPQITRQHAHELPERTMSVSDFNYQRPSPRKWAAPRVKSEDSLLDAPAGGRVPVDWRDKVLQHIGTKMVEKVPYTNGQMCPRGRPQMPVARHPSREQLIDYMMQRVSQQHPGHPCPPHEHLQQEVRVKIEKNPELGFSISGGGRGNPFRPEDNGIFVTRVQPEGPASKFLQPGDKIVQANGYSFVNIDHGQAVSLLKTFPNTVELIIVREIPA